MRLVLFLFAGLLAAPVALPAAAQAWTMPAGEAYVKLAYGATRAAEQFTFAGDAAPYLDGVDGDAFRDDSAYLYAEVGVREHLTLVLSAPYKRLTVEGRAFRYRTQALGTVSLGARMALLPLLGVRSGPHALSAALTAHVPTGYTRNYAPSAGTGQVDVQGSLAYGVSLWPVPAYVQAALGYRYRSAFYGFSRTLDCVPRDDVNCVAAARPDFGEEVVYAAEAGLTPFGGAVLVQGLVQGVWSVRAPDIGFSAFNPTPTRQRYLKLGGGVTVYPMRLAGPSALAPLGLSVQAFRTPSGRNTIKARDRFVGVEYRLPLFRPSP